MKKRYIVRFENLSYGPFMTHREAEIWAKKTFKKKIFDISFIWSAEQGEEDEN
jgi:hypothetical protein